MIEERVGRMVIGDGGGGDDVKASHTDSDTESFLGLGGGDFNCFFSFFNQKLKWLFV